MAANRVTQTGVEVLRDATAANIRITQTGVEVLRTGGPTNIRITQTGVEVLRSVAVAAVGGSKQPVVIICT